MLASAVQVVEFFVESARETVTATMRVREG